MLLHCHIEWHVEAGLTVTIIEAPEAFSTFKKPPPQSHYDACAAYPDPSSGNTAGKEGVDLVGINTEVPIGDEGAKYPDATAPLEELKLTTWVLPALSAVARAPWPPSTQPYTHQIPGLNLPISMQRICSMPLCK